MHRHAGKNHHSGKHAMSRRHHGKRHHSAQVSKSGKRNQFRSASFTTNKPSRRVGKSSGMRTVNNAKFGKNTCRFWKPTFNSKRTFTNKQPVNAVKPPTTSSTKTVK
jgi:hypothetical protein